MLELTSPSIATAVEGVGFAGPERLSDDWVSMVSNLAIAIRAWSTSREHKWVISGERCRVGKLALRGQRRGAWYEPT